MSEGHSEIIDTPPIGVLDSGEPDGGGGGRREKANTPRFDNFFWFFQKT